MVLISRVGVRMGDVIKIFLWFEKKLILVYKLENML